MNKFYILIFFIFSNIYAFSQKSDELPYDISVKFEDSNRNVISKYDLLKDCSNSYYPGLKLFIQKGTEIVSDNPLNHNSWDRFALIQIGDYFYETKFGASFIFDENKKQVKVIDAFEDGSAPLILINTGCFSDAGCMDLTYVIRLQSSGLFSVVFLDHGIDMEKLNNSGEVLIKSELYDPVGSDCFLIRQSYQPTQNSFRKSDSYFEKIKIECAG